MKKKEIIALVAVIIAAVVMISIGSYAYFTAQVTGTSQANTITSGTMAITYADGPSITLDNAIPGDTVVKTFTVTNTGNVDSNYDVYLSEVNNGFADQTDLAYSLVSTDGGYSTTSDIQVPSAATKIVSAQAITASATHHYTLTIKFLNKTTNQDINQGKTFSAKIQVNEYKNYVNLTKNLAHDLTEIRGGTTTIAAKTAPTYANNATTDEGMFATTDDYGTSYYYRGAVTNNNVLFGGFCWKVIRINGNGTTRMIYNGTPSDGKCTNTTGTDTQIGTSAYNTNNNDNAYVGYMYGTAGSTTYEATHANTNSSTIKTAIDAWYNTNLASYASKISDTEFCNDRSTASTAATWRSSDTAKGYGTNETYYGAYNRRFNTHVPELTCQNKNDRFTVSDTTTGNGNLTNPVGLITMDEVGFAGASMSSFDTNNSYYLYTNGAYWTMSSFNFNGGSAHEFYVTSGGNIDVNGVNYTHGLRPVINLKTDTLYTSGDGTSASPYVIS
jgi:hypothetical protein